MSLQYRRVCQVLVGDQTKGEGLVVNQDFRIKFRIIKTITSKPNSAMIHIYNLSPSSKAKVRDEYDEVIVNAGYQDSARLLFAGNIRRRWSFHEGVNEVTDIRAADGDDDYRNTVVNASFRAGVSDQQILRSISEKFATTKLGDISALAAAPRARGKVISGVAREVIAQISDTNDAHWSIQDGSLQFVAFEGTLPDKAIVIRADTGMLRVPEISDKGIRAWCLLNPALKCGGKVQLDNEDLRERVRAAREGKAGAKKSKEKPLAKLSPDGIYRINRIVHEGDTRDRKWESEILCTALGTPIPSAAREVTNDDE